MTLAQTIQADLTSINTDMGSPVVEWSGEEYPCVPSSLGNSQMLELGGFEISNDLSLTINKSLFTGGVYPKETQSVIYNSHSYKITKVITDGSGGIIRLLLASPNRGV